MFRWIFRKWRSTCANFSTSLEIRSKIRLTSRTREFMWNSRGNRQYVWRTWKNVEKGPLFEIPLIAAWVIFFYKYHRHSAKHAIWRILWITLIRMIVYKWKNANCWMFSSLQDVTTFCNSLQQFNVDTFFYTARNNLSEVHISRFWRWWWIRDE